MCAPPACIPNSACRLREVDELVALAQRARVRVTGLHAHTGSGIFDVANWTETGALLADSGRAIPAM